jgi:hypothetical protein
MSVRPAAASSVLPPVLREQGNKKPPDHNRFAPLRDRTPSVSSRPPASPATKRPPEDQLGPEGKAIRIDSETVFGTMENIEKMLAKGRGDMHKAKDVVSKDPGMPASGKEFLGGLASAYDNMADAMEALSTLVSDMCKQKSGGGGGVAVRSRPLQRRRGPR